MKIIFMRLAALALGAMLNACLADDANRFVAAGNCDVAATAANAVDKAGPFKVGYRVIDYTYTPKGETAARTIPVHVWYPTNDTTGETGIRYQELFTDVFGTQIGVNPAPPLSDCGYPVMVYSHGHMGFAGGAAFLTTHFASHGWLAVAPEHVGNTLTDNIDPRPPLTYLSRPQDFSAAIDAIDALPEGDFLAKLAATDRVLATGHSFGVFTMWAIAGLEFDAAKVEQFCNNPDDAISPDCTDGQAAAFKAGFKDERVVAAVLLDGGLEQRWHDVTDTAAVDLPLVMMTGTESYADAASDFAALQAPNLTWLEFAGGCHESFNSAIFTTGCETLAVEPAYQAIQTYTLAFARQHVLRDGAAGIADIVDGQTPLLDEISFTRK